MTHQPLVSVVTPVRNAVHTLARCLASVAGQTLAATKSKKAVTTKTWTPPLTPDGQPDLQGFWSYATLTPLGETFLQAKKGARC